MPDPLNMASSGKKGKKSKGKTLPLNDFLQEVPGAIPVVPIRKPNSNWADEVEDSYDSYEGRNPKPSSVVLPTAPKAARGLDDYSDKIPQSPPFIAYLSNLPYDVDEDEIADFFSKLKISNMRIPKEDRAGEGTRVKGFGYVEFEDQESLIEALAKPTCILKGRRIRIEVATNSENDRRKGGRMDMNRDRMDRPEVSTGDWRSGGRKEPEADRRPTFRDREGGSSGGFSRDREGGGGGFSRDREGGGGFSRDREGGGGFSRDREGGGGFSRDREGGGGFSRDREGGGGFSRDREGGGGFTRDRGEGMSRERDPAMDKPMAWRDAERPSFKDGDKPPMRDGGERRGYDRDGGRGFDRDGGERRGFGPRRMDREDGGRRMERDDGPRRMDRDEGPRRMDRDERNGGFPRREEPERGGEGRTRPKLNLAPRSKPVENAPPASAAEKDPDAPPPKPAVPAASIFGDARPVDTSARERQIEERLAKLNTDGDRDDRKRDEGRSRRMSPDKRRYSPRRSPDNRRERDSSEPKRGSPDRQRNSPGRREYSPDQRGSSPERRGPSPDNRRGSPVRRRSDDKRGPPPRADRAAPKHDKEKKPPSHGSNSDDESNEADPAYEPNWHKDKDEREFRERDMPKVKTPEPINIVAQNQYTFLEPEDSD